MTMLAGLKRESTPSRPGGREHDAWPPLLAALGLSLLGFVAIGLAGARPAIGADPTMSPFEQGRQVYDYGKVLSTLSATTAEALAAHIDAAGAGRVVVYTVPEHASMPAVADIAQNWNVDGLLLTAQGSYGQLKLGSALKAKLSSDQLKFLNGSLSSGPATTESWFLSTLARVDAFVSGTHVFDGTGILDAGGKQQAETAAKNLGSGIGATVYIDIAIGADDPSTTAFFNGAGMSSDFGKSLVIALAVSGGQIGGYIDYSSGLGDSYTTGSPWKRNTLSNEAAPNGDVRAALLAAIDAVQKPPLISGDMIAVIVFVVVVVLFSITAPFLWGPWLIRKLTGTTGPIKNGLPGDAIIESIADTGMTVTMPSVGPEAPEYKFVLQVTPAGGGAPYQVETKALVPRLFIPMTVPGASIGVLIDPTNPQKVSLDFSRMGGGGAFAAPVAAGPATMMTAGGVMDTAGVPVTFDAQGNPTSGLAALVGAVQSGTMPAIKGKAATLLATGTHGTAVVTSAQPLGKKVRDIDPSAEPSHLDDPIWLFTLEVTLAGRPPFTSMFGHRVPAAKVSQVAPGVKLAVAVDESNPSAECAIDWDRSPLAS
ncbi:MAG: hypothetical protein ABSE70_03140 [Candidatus Limnocylindrales bacterium]